MLSFRLSIASTPTELSFVCGCRLFLSQLLLDVLPLLVGVLLQKNMRIDNDSVKIVTKNEI